MPGTDYIEFSDPRLVALYNTINPITEYKQFYLDLAKKLSASTILDIGCGSGLLTCELSAQGHRMIGIDPSSAVLTLARKSHCGSQIEWIEGDALSLDERNADLAIMTGHVAQFYLDDEYWLDALQSIHRALRSGGHVAFESRNPAVQPWNNYARHSDWPSRKSPRRVNDSRAGNIEWWMELGEVLGERVRYENHYLFTKSDEELVSINELRFRTREEISQSLKTSGFSVDHVYGNWDSSLANIESPEFIFVATRK